MSGVPLVDGSLSCPRWALGVAATGVAAQGTDTEVHPISGLVPFQLSMA